MKNRSLVSIDDLREYQKKYSMRIMYKIQKKGNFLNINFCLELPGKLLKSEEGSLHRIEFKVYQEMFQKVLSMELLRKKGVNMLQLDGLWASPNRFDVPTDRISDPIPVLYQSGYLTIKEYNSDIHQYRLDFPNEEVRQGISEIINHQE